MYLGSCNAYMILLVVFDNNYITSERANLYENHEKSANIELSNSFIRF